MPKYLNELIDRASKAAGSDTALAKELEVSKTVVSDWRHGRRRCSPEDQALMAAMSGLDAEAWGARGMIEKHEGTTKGAKLQEALKKALLATGAAMLSASINAAPVMVTVPKVLDTMYRMLTNRRTFSNGTLMI
jgi:hypothetical protein